VLAALARVANSGRYVLGPEVVAFERAWADYCGARHCVGVASGTDALTLLLAGLTRGGRVLVPANTAPPTYTAICEAGLTPWFVDVGDDELLDLAALPEYPCDDGAVALLPVHLYGRVGRIALLATYAAQHGLRLVEDACQAHGAYDPVGHRPGELSAGAAWSFYPTKNLAALGDGGAVTTNDDDVAERVRRLRGYGYVPGEPGTLGDVPGRNSRLDELQAAVLSARLPHLARRNAQRLAAVSAYRAALTTVGLDVYAGTNTNHHLLVVRVPRRDAVRAALIAAGVAAAVHYPVPGHRQAPFSTGQQLPQAEAWCAEALTLPLWPGMTENTIHAVVAALRAALMETR
jgi:dTDP-4-amino-4,6-dideoxygalactose transaminase